MLLTSFLLVIFPHLLNSCCSIFIFLRHPGTVDSLKVRTQCIDLFLTNLRFKGFAVGSVLYCSNGLKMQINASAITTVHIQQIISLSELTPFISVIMSENYY